jgi:hypothetical protein
VFYSFELSLLCARHLILSILVFRSDPLSLILTDFRKLGIDDKQYEIVLHPQVTANQLARDAISWTELKTVTSPESFCRLVGGQNCKRVYWKGPSGLGHSVVANAPRSLTNFVTHGAYAEQFQVWFMDGSPPTSKRGTPEKRKRSSKQLRYHSGDVSNHTNDASFGVTSLVYLLLNHILVILFVLQVEMSLDQL